MGVVSGRVNDVDPAYEAAAEAELRDELYAASGIDPFDEPDPSWDDPNEFVEDE